MVGILSIDFDYFIATSAAERDRYFPKGGDEISPDKLNPMWEERYWRYPQLREIGVIPEYYTLKNFLILLKVKQENVFRSDTHKEIKNVIDAIPWDTQLRIVNIDFHHDYYHYFSAGEHCNCGNWLRRVVEERPGTEVKWIRREDSQIYSLEGKFPFEHTTDLTSVLDETYEYVFLCRSPEWSPPHLTSRYEALIRAVLRSEIA